MSETRIPVAELQGLVARYMSAANVSEANAAAIARGLVGAEIDGQKGHGLSRIDSYAGQARSGKVDGHAEPSLLLTRPGAAMIDVGHGFSFRALELATDCLPAMAATTGVAAAGLFRSHHAGALGQPVERLANAGMLALMFANTPQAMTAWHGHRAVFGTNPIAFAAPRRAAFPLIVDLALSQVARGKLLAAAKKGESIPEGWAKDSEGLPTTDAKAALGGTLEPIGGSKGAALALMVEVLAASLVGANHAFEASSFFEPDGPSPAVGQLLIAISPAAFAGSDIFAHRLETLVTAIESDEDARLPGSRKPQMRAAAARDGLAVSDDVLAKLRSVE